MRSGLRDAAEQFDAAFGSFRRRHASFLGVASLAVVTAPSGLHLGKPV